MTALETLLQKIINVKVIAQELDYSEYMPLDLSVNNAELLQLDLGNATTFEEFIQNKLALNNSKVGFGGYNEERNLYKRSTVFKDSDTEERNIHIGLDVWIAAGTPVLAAIDGSIHSFANNANLGDYGPTIILEHQLENLTFYTLYGHLSLESLTNLTVGTFFEKGQQIATLGESTVNGDYAPHLHFQIIHDLGAKKGDYPGVSSKNELAFYLKNCPDPNLLLKIEN
ncbi:peptidoglycan DD-metalloendopeptidase family protein [Flavobacterium restrictum]|uniref:Peptidoglycan DD-metalloendopeptidase family protein n=1 Tax=Flavobacterium restrictum TaxID=2594428 RepID=A0A553DSP3_9FLAO|nr:peptidoglycan DD-metalloendopeptidase family protein [Flavobacterium restrictum]TRX35690.1 peptidoglycan DD-metalloendopeptidase family protein [Flavobacterium restrictum]